MNREVNASKKLNYRDRRERRGFASGSGFARLCRMLRLAGSLPYFLYSKDLGVLSVFSLYSVVFFNDLLVVSEAVERDRDV